jgi:hypothetical protein
MTTLRTRTRVGKDGSIVLSLSDAALANATVDVVVVLQPVGVSGGESKTNGAAGTHGEDDVLTRVCGAWQGADLVRPEQGEYEEREPLG